MQDFEEDEDGVRPAAVRGSWTRSSIGCCNCKESQNLFNATDPQVSRTSPSYK